MNGKWLIDLDILELAEMRYIKVMMKSLGIAIGEFLDNGESKSSINQRHSKYMKTGIMNFLNLVKMF
ncbi:hypothetical protein COU57_05665 [Candidatus Pacearchaeota archaeon CG10_big_fil_rev_8_21_14_0_10_32_14]|nr:MAG: hypothetical protein COU57_05665 [Candidatus Pacearchaeota archaeon CG10_big_fil_rev_8_21_14_0_10_32_14]